jgi:hypothetical protein
MATGFYRSIFLPLIFFTMLASNVHADTFEFLTYTPPSSGWTKQMSADGPVYRRANGIGLISFYASYPTTASASDEFATMWRARIKSTLDVQAPQPVIQPEGEFRIAVGAQQVDAQGTITVITLVTIVGRGRAIGVVTVTAGDDALREVSAFLDKLAIGQGTTADSVQGDTIDVDFAVPPGYVSERDGKIVVLKPRAIDRTTPCIYGVSPSRPSRGSLDADARAALLEPLPGWQIKSEHYNAMRGIAGTGWQYYWYRTDVQRLVGGKSEYLTAMAMAFPSGQGKVSIFWGFGATGPCTLDDLTFLRVFHSLSPRGVKSDGGRAFARELHGTWRDTQTAGMAQYRFLADGRYEYGLGTSTTFGNLETRTGGVKDGRWEFRGSELILTGGRAGRYRLRIYDEFVGGVWRRALSVFNESGNSAGEVQYMKIGN